MSSLATLIFSSMGLPTNFFSNYQGRNSRLSLVCLSLQPVLLLSRGRSWNGPSFSTSPSRTTHVVLDNDVASMDVVSILG